MYTFIPSSDFHTEQIVQFCQILHLKTVQQYHHGQKLKLTAIQSHQMLILQCSQKNCLYFYKFIKDINVKNIFEVVEFNKKHICYIKPETQCFLQRKFFLYQERVRFHNQKIGIIEGTIYEMLEKEKQITMFNVINTIKEKDDCFMLFEGINKKEHLEILSKKFKKHVKECQNRIVGHVQEKSSKSIKWEQKMKYLEKFLSIKNEGKW